jgi:hypothetical protein
MTTSDTTSVPEAVRSGWTTESGCHAAREFAADRRVTAILCANHDLALGVPHRPEAGRAGPRRPSPFKPHRSLDRIQEGLGKCICPIKGFHVR